ncbi:MAG: hypothetical protein E7192_01800 [Erysipelotrichaceae bacterium]|nr:hypothetical protein [Erysipelotrichaceae bacterium]
MNKILVNNFEEYDYKIYSNNLDLIKDTILNEIRHMDIYNEGDFDIFVQNVRSNLDELSESKLQKLKLLVSWVYLILKRIDSLSIGIESFEPFPANDPLKRICSIMFANYRVNARHLTCDLCVVTMNELRKFSNDANMVLYNGITRYKEYDVKVEFDKGRVKDYYQQLKEGCRAHETNKLFYIICCKHVFRDSTLSVIWSNNVEIVYLTNLLDCIVYDVVNNDGINFEQTFLEIEKVISFEGKTNLDRYMRFKCNKSTANQ